MTANFIETSLPGVIAIEPHVYRDDRGFFLETFHQEKYGQGGIPAVFVQDNHSFSVKNTLRGLHYQLNHSQAKLVYALTGAIFDVAVDIRKGSPSFGKWVSANLSEENKKMLFIPAGFAHGYLVLSEEAEVVYKISKEYSKEHERGILWKDPTVKVDWPLSGAPILSEKDKKLPLLQDAEVFKYENKQS